MKNIFLTVILLCTVNIFAQNVGINSTNATPDASAMLDVNSTNTGLLIPRVALIGTTDVTTITAAATSLLIYNTATVSDVTPGYYYWDGTVWLRMLEGGTNYFWKTTGNAGTTVGANFIGTTDAQDFAIYTNNTEKIRVDQTGYVGIGTSTPGEQLTIGANNFVFHNGGDKAIGFNTDWTPIGQWTKITGSNYQGRIHFNPATGSLGFISSDSLTNLNNLDDNRIFIQGGTGNVGIGTVAPDPSAILDASSSNKGFLPPNISLTSKNDIITILNPATGLLIYNTASAGTGTSTITPGYYYFDGIQWKTVGENSDWYLDNTNSFTGSLPLISNPSVPTSGNALYTNYVTLQKGVYFVNFYDCLSSASQVYYVQTTAESSTPANFVSGAVNYYFYDRTDFTHSGFVMYVRQNGTPVRFKVHNPSNPSATLTIPQTVSSCSGFGYSKISE